MLAGRFAGGRAYGYRRINTVDSRGEVVRGVMEIVPAEAEIVRRIHADFAAGLSSIAIATALNKEGVPGSSRRTVERIDHSRRPQQAGRHPEQPPLSGGAGLE